MIGLLAFIYNTLHPFHIASLRCRWISQRAILQMPDSFGTSPSSTVHIVHGCPHCLSLSSCCPKNRTNKNENYDSATAWTQMWSDLTMYFKFVCMYYLCFKPFLWFKPLHFMSDTTCRTKIYVALYFDPFKQFVPVQYVKAVVRKFCFFVGVSVWKPGIAVLCGIIFLA